MSVTSSSPATRWHSPRRRPGRGRRRPQRRDPRPRRQNRPAPLAWHAVAGARWSRWRRRRAASPTGRCGRRTSSRCSMPGSPSGAHRLPSAGRRSTPTSPAAAPHLRPLRHRRSGLGRGLTGAWRLSRAGDGSRRRAGRRVDAVKRRACAAAAGAGFPTASRNTVMLAEADREIRGLHADEGDSWHLRRPDADGGDPFTLIEGMTIAAVATAPPGLHLSPVGISAGSSDLKAAITAGERAGVLATTFSAPAGPSISRSGSGRRYICRRGDLAAGEPEGRRGIVRPSPRSRPLKGLFGKPTLVNTFCPSPPCRGSWSMADRLMRLRHGRVAGHPADPARRQRPAGGLIELAFGITWAGGDRGVRARHRVGPAGAGGAVAGRSGPISPTRSSTRRSITRPSRPKGWAGGHGGIVVFDDTVDMARQPRFAFEFCAVESCGKCTPSASARARAETMDRVHRGRDPGEPRPGRRPLRGHDRRLALPMGA